MRKRTITVNGHRLEVECRRHYKFVGLPFFGYFVRGAAGERGDYLHLRAAVDAYFAGALIKVSKAQDRAMNPELKWKTREYYGINHTLSAQTLNEEFDRIARVMKP